MNKVIKLVLSRVQTHNKIKLNTNNNKVEMRINVYLAVLIIMTNSRSSDNRKKISVNLCLSSCVVLMSCFVCLFDFFFLGCSCERMVELHDWNRISKVECGVKSSLNDLSGIINHLIYNVGEIHDRFMNK